MQMEDGDKIHSIPGLLFSSAGKPIQVLENIPGFIPVYIRHGNEALEDINPLLAEAFHEKKRHTKVISLEGQDASKLDSSTPEDIPQLASSKKKRQILYSTFQE
ncbi:uncharacterized protein [Fopius arisanus]|uniref:Uncharacterized protein isoform X2 n=1 Tax=Fopius arisanus TaxID=64838 RepID=A0A9R1U1K7_9HYME|nr:PREDICTED: uncharacterized protein LOC105267002 isoform X2 [Fopius arisanus]